MLFSSRPGGPGSQHASPWAFHRKARVRLRVVRVVSLNKLTKLRFFEIDGLPEYTKKIIIRSTIGMRYAGHYAYGVWVWDMWYEV